MKKRVFFLAILFLLLGRFAVSAGAEPTGFSDIPWGTSMQAARERCGRPNLYSGLDGTNAIYCEGRPVTLSKSGHVTPQLLFDDAGGLSGYLVMPNIDAYAALRAVVVEKFGTPYKDETENYSTKVGDAVTGEVVTWVWASGTVAHLRQLCGRIDRSCLTVMTKPLIEQRRREQESAKGKARK